MNKDDILIFMSDQHRSDYIGMFNDLIETPYIDSLSKNGTTFTSCYSACPLCVPSRVSFISCQSPNHTKVFTNSGAIRNDVATFLHSLVANGYETVLCGRMHFEGENQRFGFTKRICGDISQQYPGQTDVYKELAHYRPTIGEKGCMEIVGGGENSPTLNYDRTVIDAAIKYLNEEHSKPQCIVVGVYAPHFPYVAPINLYKKYKSRVSNFDKKKYTYRLKVLAQREQKASYDMKDKVKAAYCGMIENLDTQIGKVHKAWKKYLQREKRQGIFIYTSDHGDQLGERELYAKNTLFENSVGVPFIIEGNSIPRNYINKTPISLMDIGVTLCDITKADIPYGVEGKSFLPQLNGEEDLQRYVVSQCMEKRNNQFVPGIMIRRNNYKYITYFGYESEALLFDLDDDPNETVNMIHELDHIRFNMEELLKEIWKPQDIVKDHIERVEHIKLLSKWGAEVLPLEDERWKVKSNSLRLPILS